MFFTLVGRYVRQGPFQPAESAITSTNATHGEGEARLQSSRFLPFFLV